MSSALQQYVASEGCGKFRRAKHLTDVQSKSDPETEPYKSLYEARQIWAELKSDLEALESDDVLYAATIASLHFHIGVNFTDSDETSSGEEHLRKGVELLEPLNLNENTCNVLQNCLNYMGILWTNRRQADKALDYLTRAERLYTRYQHEIGSPPLTIDELLDPLADDVKAQKRTEYLQETYTKTTYYLAQVYTRLEQNDKAAHYCLFTLKRQLESKYDPLDWSTNAATLSQYYIPTNIPAARHCLASASIIAKEVERKEDEEERIPRAMADLNRCWGKYAINLLDESKEKLFEALDDEPVLEEPVKEVDRFNLDTSEFEEITDKYLLDFADARPVFLFGQRKLQEALKFYTLQDFCTDHVEVQQDISKLYKGLSFFEEDLDRQCKMEKRRVDLLSPLLSELNPQFYLLVCRQLMVEVAEIYSSMSELKQAIMEKNSATMHSAKKFNHLVQESITFYDRYLNSFNNPKDRTPENLESDDLRPYLVGLFCTGRLFSKLIPSGLDERVGNIEKSCERYGRVVEYCKTHPEAGEPMKTELELCQEMVNLLPLKIEQIKRGVL